MTRRRSIIFFALFAALVLLTACGENTTPNVSPDSVSGRDSNATMETDSGLPILECVPNLDGRIDAAEMQTVIGVPATYFVTGEGGRDVDLIGSDLGAGERRWDWSWSGDNENQTQIAASAIDDRWYADQFEGADFVAPFDIGGATEAIYRKTDSALELMGLASVEPGPDQTLLRYDTPIQLFRFPLEVGVEWLSSSDVREATLRGLPYAGRDIYEMKVDAVGEIVLPELTFTQVLRLRVSVTLQPSVGISATQRQTLFLFECYGEIARATSNTDEPDEDFTRAAEIRRLGIPQ